MLCYFALDFFEEVLEVGRGGGEDHLVGVERCAPAASESDIGEIVAVKYFP